MKYTTYSTAVPGSLIDAHHTVLTICDGKGTTPETECLYGHVSRTGRTKELIAIPSGTELVLRVDEAASQVVRLLRQVQSGEGQLEEDTFNGYFAAFDHGTAAVYNIECGKLHDLVPPVQQWLDFRLTGATPSRENCNWDWWHACRQVTKHCGPHRTYREVVGLCQHNDGEFVRVGNDLYCIHDRKVYAPAPHGGFEMQPYEWVLSPAQLGELLAMDEDGIYDLISAAAGKDLADALEEYPDKGVYVSSEFVSMTDRVRLYEQAHCRKTYGFADGDVVTANGQEISVKSYVGGKHTLALHVGDHFLFPGDDMPCFR